MARKTKEEKEKTFQALVESAAVLFSQQGYSRTTLNEISEHAGMTRGAFYWHFSSKNEIVKAIWEQHATPVMSDVKDALENLPAENPVKEFRHLLKRLLHLVVDDDRLRRSFYIVMHNMEISDKEGVLIDFMKEQHLMFGKLIEDGLGHIEQTGQLKPHVEPRLAAMGCVALYLGMIDKSILPFTHIDLKIDGTKILEHYLDSILLD